jgi:hypothetical protein
LISSLIARQTNRVHAVKSNPLPVRHLDVYGNLYCALSASGRHTLQHDLSLVYSSGYGNSPFSFVWALNIPSVARVLLLPGGGIAGWVVGIFLSPRGQQQQRQFETLARAIGTFISGFLLAKLAPLIAAGKEENANKKATKAGSAMHDYSDTLIRDANGDRLHHSFILAMVSCRHLHTSLLDTRNCHILLLNWECDLHPTVVLFRSD